MPNDIEIFDEGEQDYLGDFNVSETVCKAIFCHPGETRFVVCFSSTCQNKICKMWYVVYKRCVEKNLDFCKICDYSSLSHTSPLTVVFNREIGAYTRDFAVINQVHNQSGTLSYQLETSTPHERCGHLLNVDKLR